MLSDPLIIAIVVSAIAGLVKVAEQATLKQNQRLKRIEQKLDLLLNHLAVASPEDTPFLDESVRALLKAGLVSSAIKTYSENTGVSPEEAEEIILAIDRHMKRRLSGNLMEFFTILLSGLLGILFPAGFVIDSVAENAIRDQLDDVEQLEVRVDNAPSYQILQGKVQRVRIAGRGLFPVEGLRIDTVEVETDAIAINPDRLQEGRAVLEQPVQAGIRLVLKQADLNQALQSPEIAEQLRDLSVNLVSRSGAEQLQRYDFINPRIEFIDNDVVGSTTSDRIRIQIILLEQETQEELQIVAELGLEKISALQLQIVEPSVSANGEPVPQQLIQPLIDGINPKLNLRNLETFGITARLLQLELTLEALNLAAFVQIHQP